VLDQRGRHIGKHGAAMLRRAIEPSVSESVAHDQISVLSYQ
jgi:hypothetical protein